MTTTTLTGPITSPTTRTTHQHGSATRVWQTGTAAGLVAAAATSSGAAVARAGDVSLRVSGKAIPVIGFAQVTLVAAIIGTVLAVVLSHRAARPRSTFMTTTIVLTALSFVPDLLADARTSTRLTLALTHVVAAVIVIPVLASRLRPSH